jgi:hypothetical protein
MDVSESDHKPVIAELQLLVPSYQQHKVRQVTGRSLYDTAAAIASGAGALEEGVVPARVEPRQLRMHDQGMVEVTNPTRQRVCWRIIGWVDGDKLKEGGEVPSWLDVWPVAGTLGPLEGVKVELRGRRGGDWGRVGPQSCSLLVAMWVDGSLSSRGWPCVMVKTQQGLVDIKVSMT